MSYTNRIASQLLHCGYLDVNFLDNLLESYQLDLDIEEIRMNFGTVDNINVLIYEAYEQIKNMFVAENEEKIQALGFNTDDFEPGREYEIFTNYLDSHLRFNDESLDEVYQNWRRH